MQIFLQIFTLLGALGMFLYGMTLMSEGLQKAAGDKLRSFLASMTSTPFKQVLTGLGITAIIQSSSATTVMVVSFVNAGLLSLANAIGVIMGANIGTTITGVLVALKNDYFNMIMYLLAFAGVMMGFVKKEKVKILGSLFCGLGLIFVGLEVMISEQAFGNPLVEDMFTNIFQKINFPLLLILVGILFTALIQSSSASTGVVITMVGANVLPLDLALFIVLGANIGTCVTALLASVGANANSKRVALIHFTFNVIGTILFTIIIWIFREPIVNLLVSIFPGNDAMSLQMRVSIFHVIFNVTTTCILLPFVKQLVKYSCLVIKDKKEENDTLSLKYVDDRLVKTPPIALMQVKKEIDYMIELVEKNISLSFLAVETGSSEHDAKIRDNEKIIDFTNSALTDFLIKLSATNMEQSDEKVIGTYFHVLNDLERIGDYAENFHEIGTEMASKKIAFSEIASKEIAAMRLKIFEMFAISKDAFENQNKTQLPTLTVLEETVDKMKKDLTASHFARLANGNCNMSASPYYSSLVSGLERVADHLVNVGYSIVNPIGSQK